MRRIGEVLLILIGAFAAIRLGWPTPAFFVALILFMCSLRLFSFTKGPIFNTRLFFSLGVFALFALVMAWLLNEFLALALTNDPRLLNRNAVTAFLTETNSLRSFWITLSALVIALILGAFAVVPASIANGRITYGAHEQYQGQERQATLSAARDIIGINKGIWLVKDGASRIIADQTESLEALGGPATLIVQDGNAVILERVGQISRVVGSGLRQLEPYERVAMVVPLTMRSEHLNIANVVTADRIIIENFELWAFHRVLEDYPASPGATSASAPNPASTATAAPSAPAAAKPNSQGRFPFNADLLIERVWNLGGGDWRNSVRNVVETATRDVVGRHTLEEILPLADANRWAFRQELIAAINRVTSDLMGVNVTAVDFGEVRVPAEVRDSLQALLVADWKADTAEKEVREVEARSQAEAARLGVLEAKRAVAQYDMMVAINRGLTEMQNANVDISALMNMRLIEALEKMAENPATNFVIPADAMQLLAHMRPTGAANTGSGTTSVASPAPPVTVPPTDGNGASAGDAQSA